MHRSTFPVFALLIAVSLLLAACQSAASTSTIEPTAAVTETELPETGSVHETKAGELPEIDPAEVQGDIITAGSSTVFPLSEAMVALFESEGYTGNITIDEIGSGAGFERCCVSGETDIANASRAIKDSEVEACRAIGREPIEFRVGTDALAIVVNPANDFIERVTLADLALIFSDKAVNWSDVNPAWPNEPIKRYTPGTDSGTYDFFIEAVMQPAYNGDAVAGAAAYLAAQNLQQSENDNVLVQGIQGDQYAIGHFGYAYYQENQDTLKILYVNDVEPNDVTAENGEYPLARPLFIYSDATIMEKKPQVAAFINFYLTRVNDVITEVGYFPASEAALHNAKRALLDAVAP